MVADNVARRSRRPSGATAGKTLASTAFLLQTIHGTVGRVGSANVEPFSRLALEDERGASKAKIEEARQSGGIGVGEDDGDAVGVRKACDADGVFDDTFLASQKGEISLSLATAYVTKRGVAGKGREIGRMIVGGGVLHFVKVDAIGTVDESTASCGCKVARTSVDEDGFETNGAGKGNSDGKLVVDVRLRRGVSGEALMPWFDDILGGFGRIEVGTPYFITDNVLEQAGGVSVDGRESSGSGTWIAIVLIGVDGVAAHDDAVMERMATTHIHRFAVRVTSVSARSQSKVVRWWLVVVAEPARGGEG